MGLSARLALSAVVGAAVALGAACGGTVHGVGNSTSSGTGTGAGGSSGTSTGTSIVIQAPGGGGVDKIDILLAVENTRSMADKQAILAEALPDLLTSFANPPCVDPETMMPVATQPAGPTDACAAGSVREFPPVLDIHVGLVTSSLGDFGINGACPTAPASGCPAGSTSTPANDHGHLVNRDDPCGTTSTPTFQNQGFLAWNPQQGAPSGSIAQLGAVGMGGLVGDVHDIVEGVGADGCGFASQNEAWYRFLVDPTPYATITYGATGAVTMGVDSALLAQRADFLRPDSMLAILVVAAKPDGSIREFDDYPLLASLKHLPHATAACRAPLGPTTGPNDPCCLSCAESQPPSCTPDPLCTSSPSYTNADEDISIRAFGLVHHKVNYGIEFMYPPSRYVQALTSPSVMDVNGKTVPNPIYSNLAPQMKSGTLRDPSLVFYAALVGVPWQLIARQNKQGQPDLVNGVSSADPTQVGGFKTGRELLMQDAQGHPFWDDIAGDPEHYVAPRSPFMQESTVPRVGSDPITGAAISPAGTPNGSGSRSGVTSVGATGNTLLNDHEYTIPGPPGDIEYACIFPLAAPIDEGPASSIAGDCSRGYTDNPLCSPNPNDGMKPTLQTSAKAYPGVKHLAIAKGMGAQGIVGSLCPAQLMDASKADYGYRPSMQAIFDRLKQALHGACFPKQLTEDTKSGSPSFGQVDCVILEATKAQGACTCDASKARETVPSADAAVVAAAMVDPISVANGFDCFCELHQLCESGAPGCTDPAGGDVTACQTMPASAANGWCYVDASVSAAQAAVVQGLACPASEPRQIRFLGASGVAPGGVLFLGCGPGLGG